MCSHRSPKLGDSSRVARRLQRVPAASIARPNDPKRLRPRPKEITYIYLSMNGLPLGATLEPPKGYPFATMMLNTAIFASGSISALEDVSFAVTIGRAPAGKLRNKRSWLFSG